MSATPVAVSPAAAFANSPEVRRVAGRLSERVPPLQVGELNRLVERAAQVWSFPDVNQTRAFDPDGFCRSIDSHNESLGIRPVSGSLEPTCSQLISAPAPRPAWDKIYFFRDPNQLDDPTIPGYSVCTQEARDAMRQRGYVQVCFINYAADIPVSDLPPRVGAPVQVSMSRPERGVQPWDEPGYLVVLPQRVPGFGGTGTVAEQHIRY